MRKKIFTLFFIIFICAEAVSQASASANIVSRATVVEPIKIQKTVDLNFGNVIGDYNPGSIVLSPDGTRVAFGVQVPNAVPGQVNAAEAIVTHGDLSYDITLPESFTLFNQENPNQVLIIDQFTVEPEPNPALEGSDVIKIGATLNLEANQLPGFYTNTGGFSVTVSYN